MSMNVDDLYLDMENHLLQDKKPSVYLEEIYDIPLFRQYPFEMLYNLKLTEQSPKHHPEGNVWNHTLLVVDEAAKAKNKSKNQKIFMWSALLHDIGKPPTTKKRKGKITSYNHDKVGAGMAREFLQYFIKDEEFIQEVCALVRYHMQILYVEKLLPYADIENMKRDTDIQEVALLSLCDRLGRTNHDRWTEENNVKRFLQKCE